MKKLDVDEWYGILAEKMCKAILKYNGKSKLSTFLYNCFDNAVKDEFRKNSIDKHKIPIVNSRRCGESCNILDICEIPCNLDDNVVYDEIIKLYGNDIVLMYLNGYSMSEIVKLVGKPKHYVRKLIMKFKLEVENYYRERN